ncbi:hypothetical protein BUALT_Bualt01G0229400 [Buddleja alternifolia]|uniref:ATG8-interacting protein 1 n=1 Tax=Buddleja alternifolia TaxID=168488 RepID=A0AAV6YFW2_9LAMI|nr:hypothetical protein BUALT_Bualt01G0229400 [Buddleja alternifolia]
MSENKGEEILPRGNEWEVVTLTESAYAAAAGPEQGIQDSSHSNLIGNNNAEIDRAMLMSGHFGISPRKNENLPLDPEKEESYEKECKTDEMDLKHEENLNIEGLISDEFAGVPNFDGKGDSMSYYSSDFVDVTPSNLIEKEPSMYDTGKFGSHDDKAAADTPYMAEEGSGINETFESLENVQKNNEEDKYNEPSNLPCEAWWRRHAASLYGHAKNANPLWSIVVVAAVMGLVVIGHRWQRNKPQVFQLKSQLVIDDKGSGWILGPLTRLKDVNLSGQHSSYIRLSSFAEQ